jgi:hypothetical protein
MNIEIKVCLTEQDKIHPWAEWNITNANGTTDSVYELDENNEKRYRLTLTSKAGEVILECLYYPERNRA